MAMTAKVSTHDSEVNLICFDRSGERGMGPLILGWRDSVVEEVDRTGHGRIGVLDMRSPNQKHRPPCNGSVSLATDAILICD